MCVCVCVCYFCGVRCLFQLARVGFLSCPQMSFVRPSRGLGPVRATLSRVGSAFIVGLFKFSNWNFVENIFSNRVLARCGRCGALFGVKQL